MNEFPFCSLLTIGGISSVPVPSFIFAVADPGFSPGGGRQLPKLLPKTAPGGGRASLAPPLGSANDLCAN